MYHNPNNPICSPSIASFSSIAYISPIPPQSKINRPFILCFACLAVSLQKLKRKCNEKNNLADGYDCHRL